MPEGRALEGYTQNFIFVNSGFQNNVTFALSAMLNSQEILMSGLYYGAITSEIDRTQPYADITQMRLVPDINGNTRYVFIDKSGNQLKMIAAGDTKGGTVTAAPSLPAAGYPGTTDPDTGIVPTGYDGVYDPVSGLVYRAGQKTAVTVAGTTTYTPSYGVIDIKPTEGASLLQKNEELGRASNIIQTLSGLITAQNSARSAWINAIR